MSLESLNQSIPRTARIKIQAHLNDGALSLPNAIHVPQEGDEAELRKEGILSYQGASFAISPITSRNITSDGFNNCTGIHIVGTSRENGENLALGSHQVTENVGNTFRRRLKNSRIRDFKSGTLEETRDAIIFGGLIQPSKNRFDIEDRLAYCEFIQLTGRMIEDALGFKPTVIAPSAGVVRKLFSFETASRTTHMKLCEDQQICVPKKLLFLPCEVDEVTDQILEAINQTLRKA